MITDFPNGKKLIIGCIHLLPMPNTPFYTSGDFERTLEKAVKDAAALKNGGADGCIIQPVDRVYTNTDDTDYVRVACMAVVGQEVRRVVGPDFKVGVQIMWNCITPSLAAAKACGADYTRCSALVGRSRSPFGDIVGDPYKVMDYRRRIDAESVELIAEVAGYHFLSDGGYDKAKLVAAAADALKVGAHAIEVHHKDEALNNQMVADLKAARPDVKVILGGGTNVENVKRRLALADGAIVGACFENGNWGGPVCEDTVRAYIEQVRQLEK